MFRIGEGVPSSAVVTGAGQMARGFRKAVISESFIFFSAYHLSYLYIATLSWRTT